MAKVQRVAAGVVSSPRPRYRPALTAKVLVGLVVRTTVSKALKASGDRDTHKKKKDSSKRWITWHLCR